MYIPTEPLNPSNPLPTSQQSLPLYYDMLWYFWQATTLRNGIASPSGKYNFPMDVPPYLARIGYKTNVARDDDTLRGLQIARMRTVPFENLDIGLKIPIRLNDQSLWDKIVVRRRGGFCYELNGLFAWLLKQIGFEVTYLNARVFNREGKPGIQFDHLALLIGIPGHSHRWLADVGFGDAFNEPLRFGERREQPQGQRAYRLEETHEGYITWQRNFDGRWDRLYLFDLQPSIFPADYEAACLYHQTSPLSHFTKGNVISLETQDGRITLDDKLLIVTKNGQRVERPVPDKEEFNKYLKEYFKIVL